MISNLLIDHFKTFIGLNKGKDDALLETKYSNYIYSN